MSREGTNRKRGPKGPRADYEPALRAMVPLVLRGVSVSEAARQVVARGLVRIISAESASARRLRALFAKERERLFLEYQRERLARLFASSREFARTIERIVQSPEAVRAVRTMRRIAQSPDAVRVVEALVRSLEMLRSRLMAGLPVEIWANAFRNFEQRTLKL